MPPGPVTALFGPDPRVWQPFPQALDAERPLAPEALPLPPAPTAAAPEPVLLASNGLDPTLLAGLSGIDPAGDDNDGFLAWLWGVIKGDFNEDQSYDEILATMAITWIPGIDQISDIRDIVANVYLIFRDDGKDKKWAWFALVTTLIGFFPVLGSLLKGLLRIVLKGLRQAADVGIARLTRDVASSGAFDEAAGYLRRAFEGLGAGDPLAWVRSLDVSRITEAALTKFNQTMDYAVRFFEWGLETASSRIARTATRTVEIVYDAGARFRAFLTRVPAQTRVRLTEPVTARIAAIVTAMRRIQAEANERVTSGVQELLDGLENLLTRSSDNVRRPGASVSGDEMSPESAAAWTPHPRHPDLEDGAVRGPYTDDGMRRAPGTPGGWPDLPASGAANFVEATAVRLYPGDKNRIVSDSNNPAGSYWAREIPSSRADWRHRFAVLVGWNTNGKYVEYVVPDARSLPNGEFLPAWEGAASAKRSEIDPDWFLPGGGVQIWLPAGSIVPRPLKPTNW